MLHHEELSTFWCGFNIICQVCYTMKILLHIVAKWRNQACTTPWIIQDIMIHPEQVPTLEQPKLKNTSSSNKNCYLIPSKYSNCIISKGMFMAWIWILFFQGGSRILIWIKMKWMFSPVKKLNKYFFIPLQILFPVSQFIKFWPHFLPKRGKKI